MLFHTFASQDERRKYGGSAFIEIQFCRMPAGTAVKDLVSVYSIDHWQNDALYVHMNDVNVFYKEYGGIFDCGTYNNMKSGPMDLCGINYYAPSLTDCLIEKLSQDRPTDYELLVQWLEKSKPYNGFYILGL